MNQRAWLAFAALSLIWGVPYLFIKVAVDGGVSPFFLAWARIVLGASLLFAILMVLVKEVGAGRASIIT